MSAWNCDPMIPTFTLPLFAITFRTPSLDYVALNVF